MNIKLRTKAILKKHKSNFEKDFFRLMENVRKHRDIKLVTTDKKKKS